MFRRQLLTLSSWRLQGGMGGGPMDFGKNKSKFQEVPETGVTFDDVAVCQLTPWFPGTVSLHITALS